MIDGIFGDRSGDQKPRISAEQLAAVTSAMSTLIESRDLASAVQIILRCAMNLTRSRYGFIGVVGDGSEFYLLGEEGTGADLGKRQALNGPVPGDPGKGPFTKIRASNNLLGKVLSGGEAVVLNEMPPDFPSDGIFPGCQGLRRFMGIPILNKEEVVGMMGLAERGEEYSASDPAQLSILLQAAGIFSEKFIQDRQKAALEKDRLLAQDSLRRAEEEFRTLVQNSPDVIMKVDREGVISFINYTLPEYTPDQVIGTKAMDYLSGTDAERYRRALNRLFGSGEPESFEVSAAGPTNWTIRLVPLRENGEVRHAMVIATDVTESKRQAGQLQAILAGTCADVGGEFFRSLVKHLSAALEARWAFISEIIDPRTVRLRAFWAGGDYAAPFEYDIRDTPCSDTIQNGLAYFESGLRERFPKDRWLIENGVESYLAIPVLNLDGKPVGHMGVMNVLPMKNREGAERILRIFAVRAGAELNRMRAEDNLRIRVLQQAAVADLGQLALKGGDLGGLMDEAVCLVSQTLGAEFCKILEFSPDRKSLVLRAGVGWKKGLVGHASVGSDVQSQAGYTLKSGEPVIVEDLRLEKRFHGPSLLFDHGIVSGISVVISGHVQAFGVLGAHTGEKRIFTKDDAHFLQSIANVLAAAIERKRSEQALTELESKWKSIGGKLPEN